MQIDFNFLIQQKTSVAASTTPPDANGVAKSVNNNNSSDKSPIADIKDPTGNATAEKVEIISKAKEEQSISGSISESVEKIAGIF